MTRNAQIDKNIVDIKAAKVEEQLAIVRPIEDAIYDAYHAFVALHPDYANKVLDVHPNTVDNWVAAHPLEFNKLIQIYNSLVTSPSLAPDLAQTKAKHMKDGEPMPRMREAMKEPEKHKDEFKAQAYQVAENLTFELYFLLELYGRQSLADAKYIREHQTDSLGKALKPITSTLAKVAPYVQIVASFVPGIGTIASVAIGVTVGAIEGKSLDEIAMSSIESVVPGGPMVVASAKAVVNIGTAAVKGQNILKAAGNSVYSAALQYIDDPNIRKIADKAIKGVASGENVLSVAEKASLDGAISIVGDPNAKALLGDALGGKINNDSILMVLSKADNLPAGTFSKSLTSVANTIGKAGGLSLNARDEIVASCSNFVSDPAAREAISAVTSKVLTGKKPDELAQQKAKQALATVKEPSAQRVLSKIVDGVTDPKQIFDATDDKLIKLLIKSDLDSNVAKLLKADAGAVPATRRDGPVMTSDVLSGTLKTPENKLVKGKFMQLVGTGKPTLQFQPDGSTTWLVGFWFRVA